jgi:rhodanese-related sulfurtransferase
VSGVLRVPRNRDSPRLPFIPGADGGQISACAYNGSAMEHLEPGDAYEFLRKHPDALLIDCRSEMEYLFVGHPVGALHVAWNDGADWSINPHFVGQVKKLAGTNHNTRAIVLICRSGNRSQEAGEALGRAGFTRVYNVVHGFEGELDESHHRNSISGWRFSGLPWEQC